MAAADHAPNWFNRFQQGFVRGFESLRAGYVNMLRWSLANRPTLFIVFALVVSRRKKQVWFPGLAR